MAYTQNGKDPGLRPPTGSHLLVSRLVGDGESQSKACIFINCTAAVFTTHSAYGCKPYRHKGQTRVQRIVLKEGNRVYCRGLFTLHPLGKFGSHPHHAEMLGQSQKGLLTTWEKGICSLSMETIQSSMKCSCHRLWLGHSRRGVSLQMEGILCFFP